MDRKETEKSLTASGAFDFDVGELKVCTFPFLLGVQVFFALEKDSLSKMSFEDDRGYVSSAKYKSGFWDPLKQTMVTYAKLGAYWDFNASVGENELGLLYQFISMDATRRENEILKKSFNNGVANFIFYAYTDSRGRNVFHVKITAPRIESDGLEIEIGEVELEGKEDNF